MPNAWTWSSIRSFATHLSLRGAPISSLAIGAASAAFLLTGMAAKAESIDLDLAKQPLKINTVTGIFDDYEYLLKSQQWWNNQGRAKEILEYGVITAGADAGSVLYKSPVALGLNFATGTYDPGSRPLIDVTTTILNVVGSPYTVSTVVDRANSVKWAYVPPASTSPIQSSGNVGSGTGVNTTAYLGVLIAPDFDGGTLQVSPSFTTIGADFTVDASPRNAIDANGLDATFSGSFTNAPGAVGSLSFLSTGSPSGTITLTGASSYTGNTNIESGTVVLNGTSTSTTTIVKGATLAGKGSISAPVTNGGSLAPGGNGSKGTFTINGNYVQVVSGSLDLEIGGNGEGDLLQINNGQVTDLAGTVRISSLPSTSITPGIIYTGIATNPGIAYPGSSTALADRSSVTGAAGYQFVREDDPDFTLLSKAGADPTKLQFGWVQLAPDGGNNKPSIINPSQTQPGQQTINAVQQSGGAITQAATGNPATNTKTCTTNSGNASNCQQPGRVWTRCRQQQ
jgi:autotransporter-associated beta strand protein